MAKVNQYLIIGAGMTAAAAVKGIRSVDPEGSIELIGEEPHSPYKRPLLSKGLWQGKPVKSIWLSLDRDRAALNTGRRAVAIDPTNKQVTDDQGAVYPYDKLLIATGGSPRRLPFGGDVVLYYRSLDDYYRLQELTPTRKRIGVIGGGFIGSEIAAAMQQVGQEVTMIFPETGIGASLFPADLSAFVTNYYTEKGVEVLAGRTVQGITSQGDEKVIETNRGEHIRVDQVVAGIGIRPNTGLAQAAGIRVEDGIVVDEFLRTNLPGVFAAGDVASFFSPALAKRVRVEHEDNALAMGQIAGKNMAGDNVEYNHLPFFYSDLFDLGYEAVGEFNSKLNVVSKWEEPYRKGVLYYLDGQRVRGVLQWNVWGKLDAARELIRQGATLDPEESLRS